MLNPFKKEKFDYKISIVNIAEYKGLLTLKAKKELLTTLFSKAQKKLVRNEGIRVKGNPEYIEQFVIPERYHNLLTTYTEGLFGIVAKQFYENCLPDKKFQLLTHFVARCWFQRNEEKDWIIKIEMTGNYVLK